MGLLKTRTTRKPPEDVREWRDSEIIRFLHETAAEEWAHGRAGESAVLNEAVARILERVANRQ